jgi:hypothetical protein
MDGGRGQLFQSEDGHGGSAWSGLVWSGLVWER